MFDYKNKSHILLKDKKLIKGQITCLMLNNNLNI